MTETLLIKRYPNRKLYNTRDSKYINLGEIADLLEAGINISIIDNKTGEDLTRQMMAQIMVEKEKLARKNAPGDLIQKMLNVGTDNVSDLLEKLNIAGGKEVVAGARDDIEKQVQKWVERGQVTRDEVTHYFDNIQKNLESTIQTTEATVSGFWDKVLHRIDTPPDDLEKRIDILEKRIEVLEDRLSRMKKKG